MSITYTNLEENQILDAEGWLMALGHKPTIADLTQAHELGVRLDLFGQKFVLQYEGDNNFMRRMYRWALKGMTQAQLKTVLEIYVESQGHRDKLPEDMQHACPFCDEAFATYDDLNKHKVIHNAKVEPAPRTDPNLPDGCYADFDPSGKQECVFFMVKRVKHTHFRDRRFRYGKIVTGSEVTLAGTIEVREWTSDAKRLLGEQRPGEVYRGEFEEQLEHIMQLPAFYAKLFGVKMKRCFICRKALTDDISKAIGMGKDCEEKYGPTKYFSEPVDAKLAACPTCGGTDLRLTFINGNGDVHYTHLACTTSFVVDKKGVVKTTNKM
jgi:hypothetical protein